MDNILEFGIKRENEERRDGGVGIVFNPATKKFAVGEQSADGLYRLFSGGVDEGEDLQEGILREVTEESGLHDFQRVEKIGEAMSHYYNPLRKVNRVTHSTCLLVILNSPDVQQVQLEEHEKFSLTWASIDDIRKNWEKRNQNKDLDHWFYFLGKAESRLKELEY